MGTMKKIVGWIMVAMILGSMLLADLALAAGGGIG